jgi:hypothetical protein
MPLAQLRPAEISTAEFLTHCQASPEPCKKTILTYVAFLAGGNFIDGCIMHLPASYLFEKVVTWMRDHPEQGDKEWVDSLEDALTALDLCKK